MDVARDEPASIVVQLTPARPGADEWATRSTFSAEAAIARFLRFVQLRRHEGEARSYDALIYTSLDLPFFERRPEAPPPGRPGECAGMPLVSVEHVVIRWRTYREYLAACLEGRKAAAAMRDRLFETLSPGLEQVFGASPALRQRVRIWFASDTPELYELPWELIAYPKAGPKADPPHLQEAERYSFVRGVPPEAAEPPLRIRDRLRLALVDPLADLPPALAAALERVSGQVAITHVTGDARAAFRRVISEGFELVHVVADGEVSSAGEGILTFGARDDTPGRDSPEAASTSLAPGELATLLRGSCVRVVSLTASQRTRGTLLDRGKELKGGTVAIPSAYRAFALLGSSRHALPTVVTPIGPGNDEVATEFWSTFYATLADTLAVEPAVAHARVVAAARVGETTLPVALCLRQRGRETFRRVRGERTADGDAVGLSAQLQHSVDLTTVLGRLRERYGGLPEAVDEFLSRESKAQDARRHALDRLSSEDTP